jgi:hypothetical protein
MPGKPLVEIAAPDADNFWRNPNERKPAMCPPVADCAGFNGKQSRCRFVCENLSGVCWLY